MVCKNCNKFIPDESIVCGFCGEKIGQTETPKDDKIDKNKSVIKEAIDINSKTSNKNDDDKNVNEKTENNKSTYDNKAVAIRSANMLTLEQLAKKNKPIGTASFFLSELLLLIPVVNIFLLFVWAFKKSINTNRQSFARSILIWLLIFILIIFAGVLVISSFGITFESFINEIRAFLLYY